MTKHRHTRNSKSVSSSRPHGWLQNLHKRIQDLVGIVSSTTTVIVFLDARMRASSFDSQAVAVTPSGDTVTTKYGMPDLGG